VKNYDGQEMTKDSHKSQQVKFYDAGVGNMVTGELVHHSNGDSKWEFNIFNFATKDYLWQGNLEELIELVLTGLLVREHKLGMKKDKAKTAQAA
jgi:hypothetical protein